MNNLDIVKSMEWETVLMIMSTINITITLAIIIILTMNSTSNTFSRRNLLFTITRLSGMLTGSILGFSFVVPESDYSCLAIRLGTGISYVLIYASIMVNQVFIIALHTGIYLSVLYQILLFTFCLLVQVTLSIEWLVLVPPCQFNSQDHILSLFYVFLLVFFITMISVSSLGLQTRSKDSSSTCLLMIITISTWIIWMMAASLLPKVYHNAAFGKMIKTCPQTIIHFVLFIRFWPSV